MGNLATRTDGGTKLKPKKKATVKELIAENEIDSQEVVYEVTASGQRQLKADDFVEPNKEYGVVPDNSVGTA